VLVRKKYMPTHRSTSEPSSSQLRTVTAFAAAALMTTTAFAFVPEEDAESAGGDAVASVSRLSSVTTGSGRRGGETAAVDSADRDERTSRSARRSAIDREQAERAARARAERLADRRAERAADRRAEKRADSRAEHAADRRAANRAELRAEKRQASANPRDVARQMMPEFGFADCLDALYASESDWDVNADNPTSTAYGIPQALMSAHELPADYTTNPVSQIRWGLGYIRDSYGTPCAAWEFKQANDFY